MVLISLLLTFAKIGILGFGGGYAMIPLIQHEIAQYGWLTSAEFADIVAVSQMTPGPVGVNAATFIGIRAAGLPGALAATIGLLLPSLFIVSIAAIWYRSSRRMRSSRRSSRGSDLLPSG